MNCSIRQLKGIGPRKEALFAKLGISTITDILQYFPKEYEDHSHMQQIADVTLPTPIPVLICGTVRSIQEIRPRRGMTLLKVTVSDASGAVELVWFNQPFKKKLFHQGMTITAFGKWNGLMDGDK